MRSPLSVTRIGKMNDERDRSQDSPMSHPELTKEKTTRVRLQLLLNSSMPAIAVDTIALSNRRYHRILHHACLLFFE